VAATIALRMSRNDGSGTESRIASVMIFSAVSEPMMGLLNCATRRWRSCQSVWDQISPSACTSGRPAILP
jgi:hypothetical protein